MVSKVARADGSPQWPEIGYESHDWVLREGVSVPHRQRFRYAGEYRSAVSASIKDVDVLGCLSSDAVLAAEEATREIVRFDAELGAEIAPFASVLLRSESAASSRIENLTASARAIAMAELGDPRKRNAAIIVGNTRAMQAAIALADDLNEQAILDMHEALLGASQPEIVGHWRQQQVWIGGGDYGPHDAQFVPPHHAKVPEAVGDLLQFCRRNDVSPLAQAALAHAQFETIHPFPDGNGRTGRALIHSLLRAKQVTRNVTVPVSAGLLLDVDGYFSALSSYRAGDPDVIVELLARASFLAINNGRQLVADLRASREDWLTRITKRRGSAPWQLADLLSAQPIVDSALVQRSLGISASNALLAIEHLQSIGVLTKIAGDSRDRKWAANDVLLALDNFASRSGRRGI